MSETGTNPQPAPKVPQPSRDLATVCRLLSVHSPLWDNGPRPGIVLRPLPAGDARVKLLLDSADYDACRRLATVSGTYEAEVTVRVYDALSDEDRDRLRADLAAIHGVEAMWAEWPARPKIGIPVAGTVGERTGSAQGAASGLTPSEVAANREPAELKANQSPSFVIRTDRRQFIKLVLDGASPDPRVELVDRADDATKWSDGDRCNEYRLRVIVPMQPNDRWAATSMEQVLFG